MKKNILTERFNTISVKKDETFTLVLDANPSTGYLWDIQVLTGEAKRLSSEYIETEENHFYIGGGQGVERTTFRATAPGTVQMIAHFKRPHEKTPRFSRNFTVNVD